MTQVLKKEEEYAFIQINNFTPIEVEVAGQRIYSVKHNLTFTMMDAKAFNPIIETASNMMMIMFVHQTND